MDSDDLQELWAGLFVSSCTPDGRDGCCRMAISGWTVVITPSPLALNLYYKTHATGISPIAYWGDRLVSSADVKPGEEES